MDIYAAVTDRIIAQMEQGVIPWQKPWISNGKAMCTARKNLSQRSERQPWSTTAAYRSYDRYHL